MYIAVLHDLLYSAHVQGRGSSENLVDVGKAVYVATYIVPATHAALLLSHMTRATLADCSPTPTTPLEWSKSPYYWKILASYT